VDGTPLHSLTDANGAFSAAPIFPGRYAVTVTDTALAAYRRGEMTRSAIITVERGQFAQMTISLPSIDNIIKSICADQDVPAGTTSVLGHIVQRPISTTTVRGNWVPRGSQTPIAREVALSARGDFALCGVPRSVGIALHLRAGNQMSDTTILSEDRAMSMIEWRPTLVASTDAVPPRDVRGQVIDSATSPVNRATISVAGLTPVVTNDAGTFRISVPSDRSVVFEIRRIGFMPSRYVLPAGGDTSITVSMLPAAQTLATVQVQDRAMRSAKLRGFEERALARAQGRIGGFAVTAAEIERRNPAALTSMLEAFPGVRILKFGGRYGVYGIPRTIRDGPACAATIFIDGVRVQEDPNPFYDPKKPMETGPENYGVPINELLPPSDIVGIEVFQHPSDVPGGYAVLNGNCVVVLIWTK
jgi:hypothetical protein